MAELFRKEAKDKMAALERTDKPMQITSPVSWLALVGAAIIVVVASVWGFFGTLPTNISGSGIVASPTSTNAEFMEESGTIVNVIAIVGNQIEPGSELMTYKTSDQQTVVLRATQSGTVSEVLVKAGDSVKQGAEVLRVSPPSVSAQVVVFYVSLLPLGFDHL